MPLALKAVGTGMLCGCFAKIEFAIAVQLLAYLGKAL
jgi:hypothetical protein